MAVSTASELDAIGYASVCETLTNGGYLRARLAAVLSPFDLVAGGLSWGLLQSRCAVDVRFVENASIRDKIRVAEEISKALKDDIQCPHTLLPHQIQGLDLVAIGLVLQWLMLRVAAAREENAFFSRQYTSLDFCRRYRCPLFVITRGKSSHRATDVSCDAVGSCAQSLHDTRFFAQLHGSHRRRRAGFARGIAPVTIAAPRRCRILDQRQREAAVAAGPAEHAAAVLLEYGEAYVVADRPPSERESALFDAAQQREHQAALDHEALERQRLASLATAMVSHADKANGRVGSAGVGTALRATDTRRLAKMTAQLETRRAELDAQLAAESAARRRAQHRAARIDELAAEAAVLAPKMERNEKQAATAAEAATDAKKTAEFAASAAAADQNSLELRIQLAYDQLLQQCDGDKLFSDRRMKELDVISKRRDEVQHALDRCIQDYKAELAGEKALCAETQQCLVESENALRGGNDEATRAANDAIEAAELRLSGMHHEMDKISVRTVVVQRFMDSVPTSGEVAQYHQRLGELEEEVAAKFEETRLGFVRHNVKVQQQQLLKNQRETLASLMELAEVRGKRRKDMDSWTSAVVDLLGQLQHATAAEERHRAGDAQKVASAVRETDLLQEQRRRFSSLRSELHNTLRRLLDTNNQQVDRCNPSL